MSDQARASAYRLGVITLIILAVLTVAEFFIATHIPSAILLLIVALIKAAIIVQNFMHIARLWRGESH